jgi:hypothetical protein
MAVPAAAVDAVATGLLSNRVVRACASATCRCSAASWSALSLCSRASDAT